MTEFFLHDFVEVVGIGTGTIISKRLDDRGDPIYTVLLDEYPDDEHGLFYARGVELRSRGWHGSMRGE